MKTDSVVSFHKITKIVFSFVTVNFSDRPTERFIYLQKTVSSIRKGTLHHWVFLKMSKAPNMEIYSFKLVLERFLLQIHNNHVGD